MKIEETCSGAEQPVQFGAIPLGTVFRYASLSNQGTPGLSIFLRVVNGIVSLTANTFYPQEPTAKVYNYTPFPAARVVLK